VPYICLGVNAEIAERQYISGECDVEIIRNPSLSVGTMAVATGLGYTLIVTEDGNICAFGDNSDGCLGQGHDVTIMGQVRLVHEELFGGHKVVMVAAGTSRACCVTSDGSFWNWGNNIGHQLGVAHTAPTQELPVTLVQTLYRGPRKLCQRLHGNSPVVMVALGEYSTYILTANGDIWSFEQGAIEPQQVNRMYFDNVPIGMIAAAGSHIVALSRTGGLLWSWGGYVSTATGLDTDFQRVLRPTLVPETFDGGEVEFICCGYDVTMAVTTDGVLWARGYSPNGECGAADWTWSGVFRRIGGAEYFGPGGVHAVSCGTGHTLILAKNNSVWSCGYNGFGELGTPSALSGVTGPRRPMLVHIDFPDDPEVPDDNNVVVVAAGDHISFAVSSGGVVFLWGLRQYWETRVLGPPHQLPDWVMGSAANTSDDCRAGRWHVGNRRRTMAFMLGVCTNTSTETYGTTAVAAQRVPAGMTDLAHDTLRDLFENMRLRPRKETSSGVRRLMGLQPP